DAGGCAVDHRLTVFVLLGWAWAVSVAWLTLTLGADQPRLDAELPERELLVGVEADHGMRGEDQLLAARVLEQVGTELVDDLMLDARIALPVLRREPHGVLVWHVDARNRHGAVGVHLAGQLARQLHRAHLGPEHTPEGALDEACDRCLDALEQVHLRTARQPLLEGAEHWEPCYAAYVRRAPAARGRPRQAS